MPHLLQKISENIERGNEKGGLSVKDETYERLRDLCIDICLVISMIVLVLVGFYGVH